VNGEIDLAHAALTDLLDYTITVLQQRVRLNHSSLNARSFQEIETKALFKLEAKTAGVRRNSGAVPSQLRVTDFHDYYQQFFTFAISSPIQASAAVGILRLSLVSRASNSSIPGLCPTSSVTFALSSIWEIISSRRAALAS